MSKSIALSMVALAALSAACESRARIREVRGVEGAATDEPDDRADLVRARQPADEEATAPPPEADVDVATEVPPLPDAEVDLALRVKNAYGYPAECLGEGAVADGITEFSIRVYVTMTATGTVTRSSVSAPVSAAARACLEARAARLQVAGPIPDAPRSVSTSIDVRAAPRLAAGSRTEQTPPAEYALPTGARPAAAALPAVAGDGPAPGARPPTSTLPAVAGEGPAPGTRPAVTALPARGSGNSRDWMWISGSAEARGEVPDTLDEE